MASIGGVLWLLFSASDRSVVGTVIQAVSAVLVPGSALGVWMLRRRVPRTPDLDAAGDGLAVAVRARWERTATELRLIYPTRISVRWSWSDRTAGGSRIDAVGSPVTPSRVAVLPGARPVGPLQVEDGDLGGLFDVFAGLDSGRILLIGAAGAGKTSAAILLLLEVLRHRDGTADRHRVPIPVLLGLADWNAARHRLVDWAAARLELEYPFLVASEYGRGTARRLIESGRVVLFLDGLDDLPERLRPVAVRALDLQATGRVVLLSRSAELVQAVAEGGHVAGAAVLELLPVTGDRAAAYLELCRVDPPPPGWRRLVDHVRRHDDAVTRALDTPLMLSLVRDAYRPGDDMADLFPTGGFADRTEVEHHLLERFLAVAYAPSPGQPAPRYGLDQATRWLGCVAAQMNEDNSPELSWWTVHRWRPRWIRVVATGLSVTFVLGIVLGAIVAGRTDAALLSYATVFALVLGAVYARGVGQPRQWSRPLRPELFSRENFKAASLFSVTTFLMLSMTLSVWLGRDYGIMAGLLCGLAVGLTSFLFYSIARPSVDQFSPIPPATCWYREIRYRIAFGLAVGVLGGAMMTLAELITSDEGVDDVTASLLGQLAGTVPYGLVFGVVSSKTWVAFLVFCQLRVEGAGPLRMIDFLEDACARGVLRTVGPFYQFRHARLQDLLAASWHERGDR
ncbi:hypothetical protein GCM10022243_57810 [Saccharothrix violaceirubra]|uniref:NACHT domain-containing protein n=1 Tax=Saccharothrix violaceirubra TaxID=413306 RepID=A0A7W7T4B2_9PSEU|nr:hypothetical protein [Saccharothrix violaceirubra]MBB4965787.1 hypothetical protein [Saccharothrix violaceirubra]